VIGEQENQPPADLLGAVFGMQPILHLLAKPVLEREHPRLRPLRTLIGQGLGDRGPVARLSAHSPAPQLPAHRRWRATQHPRDRTHPIARGPTTADLLSLLEGKTARARRDLAGRKRVGHHPANVPEPPPGDGDRHSDTRRRLGDHHPRPHRGPEITLNRHRNRWPTTNTHAAPH